MTVTYINRRGDTYYLHRGTTRIGKPKYFFSLTEDGVLPESIPDGYEIYENPNAQVFLRRIPPKVFTEEEISIVRTGVENLSALQDFKIDIKSKAIVVFVVDQDLDFLKAVSSRFALRDDTKVDQVLRADVTYSPMLRFVVVDEEDRGFLVERMCFLGSIDDWIPVGGGDDLTQLVEEYCPQLGRESFYELM